MQYIQTLLDLMTYGPFFTAFLLVLSWLIWILLKRFYRRRPAFSTMLIYSVSIVLAFIRYHLEVLGCLRSVHYCEVPFSNLMFIFETILWFLVLYVPIKLISRASRSAVSHDSAQFEYALLSQKCLRTREMFQAERMRFISVFPLVIHSAYTIFHRL